LGVEEKYLPSDRLSGGKVGVPGTMGKKRTPCPSPQGQIAPRKGRLDRAGVSKVFKNSTEQDHPSMHEAKKKMREKGLNVTIPQSFWAPGERKKVKTRGVIRNGSWR